MSELEEKLEGILGNPQAMAQMGAVLRACREYAERLRSHSPSLLFFGRTGLGKTHLSLAIARDRLRGGVLLGAPLFPSSLNGF